MPYIKNKNSNSSSTTRSSFYVAIADVAHYVENNSNIEYEILNLSNSAMLDNTNEFLVPEDHYFFMGDNRDNSSDSRDTRNTVGFVPKENIIGKVRFIFLSIDTDFKLLKIYTIFNHLRYERFFKKIL